MPPSSRASCAAVLPLRASSMICCRNPAGHLDLGISDSSLLKSKVSVKRVNFKTTSCDESAMDSRQLATSDANAPPTTALAERVEAERRLRTGACLTGPLVTIARTALRQG